MNTNPLKGKRIALLGGIGARPEAREALIAELELASLEWVYSERNKSKEYQAFVEAYYPGKYDYVFLLAKFISHKAIDLLKSVDLGETKLVRIKGSYNAEGFLNALFEQAESKPIEAIVEEPQVIIRKTLEPARAHEGPVPEPQEYFNDHSQELVQWHKTFGVTTPEKAKANVDKKIAALEARIAQLSANQQDKGVLTAAHRYHQAMEKFFNGLAVPYEVEKSADHLASTLQKHGVDLGKGLGQWAPNEKEFKNVVMRTNAILGRIFIEAKSTLNAIASTMIYNRFDACMNCKRHKSLPHQPTCPSLFLKRAIQMLEDDMKNADPFSGPPKNGLLEKIADTVKGK